MDRSAVSDSALVVLSMTSGQMSANSGTSPSACSDPASVVSAASSGVVSLAVSSAGASALGSEVVAGGSSLDEHPATVTATAARDTVNIRRRFIGVPPELIEVEGPTLTWV